MTETGALLPTTRRWLAAGIEAAWLAAVLLVPLVFAPPGWFAFFEVPKVALARTFAGIAGTLLALDVVLAVGSAQRLSWEQAKAWLRAEPARWTLVAGAAVLVIAVAATLASPVPRIGFWGLESGRDGQSLYGLGSSGILFLAIAFRLRSHAQAWRLIGAIIASLALASAYAVLQRVGADPYHLSDFFERITGPFSNPIFAASALLMGLPLAMSATLAFWDRGRWVPVAGAVVTALLGLAIALTLARGPWVGAAAGTAAFLLLAGLTGKRAAFRAALLAGAALVLAAAVLIAFPNEAGNDEGALGSTVDRFGSIGGSVGGGLTGRVEIWQTAGKLITGRPWFDFESGGPSILRHALGYGPDTLLYTYPLAAEPSEGSIQLVTNGHNAHIHAAVETGILGLLASLAFALTPVLAGTWTLLRRTGAWDPRLRMVLAGAVAALVGRGVEQLVGVPQVSDTLLTWSLAGLVVALPPIATPQAAEARNERFGPAGAGVVRITAVAVAAALVGLTAVAIPSIVLGGRSAAHALVAQQEGDLVAAIDHLTTAIERAPSVTVYRLRAAGIFERVRLTSADVDDEQLLQGAVSVIDGGLVHNRLSLGLTIGLGEGLMQLIRKGHAEEIDRAMEQFARAAALYPNVTQTHRNLAIRLLEVGRAAEALEALDSVLAIAPTGTNASEALFFKGLALRDLGRDAEAIVALVRALAEQPSEPLERQINAMLEQLR